MRKLLVASALSSLMFGCFSYAAERELTRCKQAIGDEEAHDIFTTIMPGRPAEMVTACGSYKGGNGLGSEARGNWFNWYFLRSLAAKPDEVTKVYVHHAEPNTFQSGDGLLIRFAYSGEGSSFKNMLAFTIKITTKKFVLSYIDDQNTLREKELSESDLENK